MIDDLHTESTPDDDTDDADERTNDPAPVDPAPLDIDGADIAAALPHRDHPDEEPPGAANAPVPG